MHLPAAICRVAGFRVAEPVRAGAQRSPATAWFAAAFGAV